MPEKRKRCKTYIVNYICDKCKKAKMTPSGLISDTQPRMYQHVCEDKKCKNLDMFKVSYPHVKHI